MTIEHAKSVLEHALGPTTPNAKKITDAINALIRAYVDDALAYLKQQSK